MKITVIDVGGTFVKHALMNERAEILERGRLPTPQSDRSEFIKTLASIHRAYPDSEGIALSLPGIIDAPNGVCITSGALEFNNGAHIVDELRAELDRTPLNPIDPNKKIDREIKITLENDAKCAALAEASIGSLADVKDGFVMIFGTGIGGGFIKDHKVHRGVHFSAGEVSFIIDEQNVDPIEENFFGYRCGVPRLCEAFAREKELPSESIDGEKFFAAVEQNDPIALECLDRFTRRVAVQLFNLQMILDPERFAIGGGISAQKSFIDSLEKNVREFRAKCEINLPTPSIVACRFRNDANLIGALQHFLAT